MSRPHSHTHLPRQLYTARQVRALDQLMIEQVPISSLKLMRRAASVVLSVVCQRWPQLRRLVVFAGTGNNGGDGYYLAALAAADGIKVQVLECGDHERLSADALSARVEAIAAGVSCRPYDMLLDLASAQFSQDTVLIDAILGTGFKGPLRESHESVIEWINGSDLPVVSVDLPSGLNCDTGSVGEIAVKATMTVCLVGLKQGLFTGKAPDYAGEIVFHDLGMPESVRASPQARSPSSTRIDIHAVTDCLIPRSASTHKGQCGNVLVVGGDLGFGGAAIMAAEAAARAGAGTVTLLTRSQHTTAALMRRPEVMVRGVDEPDGFGSEQILALLQRASVVVLGPGLGNSNWSHSMLRQVLQFAGTHLPVVLDADALNLLAEYASLEAESDGGDAVLPLRSPLWVLTPHPGEAARLLQVTVSAVESDRFAAVTSLQSRWGGSVVLKGAGSLLCTETARADRVETEVGIDVCTEGNPGMASGGMGDVLAGLIGGLIAQGLSPALALRCGVCIHGEAADLAVEEAGERGLLATDLMLPIRRLVNHL